MRVGPASLLDQDGGVGASLRCIMSDLSNFLAADSVDAAMTVSNKKALFQQLATAAARKTSLRAKDIVVTLNERERLGSTRFRGGPALPHGHIGGLCRMCGFLVPKDVGSGKGVSVGGVLGGG